MKAVHPFRPLARTYVDGGAYIVALSDDAELLSLSDSWCPCMLKRSRRAEPSTHRHELSMLSGPVHDPLRRPVVDP